MHPWATAAAASAAQRPAPSASPWAAAALPKNRIETLYPNARQAFPVNPRVPPPRAAIPRRTGPMTPSTTALLPPAHLHPKIPDRPVPHGDVGRVDFHAHVLPPAAAPIREVPAALAMPHPHPRDRPECRAPAVPAVVPEASLQAESGPVHRAARRSAAERHRAAAMAHSRRLWPERPLARPPPRASAPQRRARNTSPAHPLRAPSSTRRQADC